MRPLLLALLCCLTPPALWAAPSDAAPPAPDASTEKAEEYSVEVQVLHATNAKKGIDPRIGNMAELKKPPFSAYDSYALLSKTKLALKKDDPKTLKLPNGRVLQTKLLELVQPKSGAKNGQSVVRISASINQPNGKDFLPLLEVKARPGQAFIVAGQSYKGGILVLVLRVVPEAGG